MYNFYLKFGLQKSDKIITISETYKIWIQSLIKNRQIDVIKHAYRKPDNEINFSYNKNIVFSGTLGDTYDVLNFVQEFIQYNNKNKTKIFLHIAGIGRYFNDVKKLTHGQANIKIYGFLSQQKLKLLLSKCDVGLLIYNKDAPQSIGNKLGEYCAFGLFLFNTLIGEQSKLIEKYDCGYNISYDKNNNYYDFLWYIDNLDPKLFISKRKNSYKCYEKEFNYDYLYKHLYKEIVTHHAS